MAARKKTTNKDHPELYMIVSDEDCITASSYNEILADVNEHLKSRPNLSSAKVYQLIHIARKTVSLDGPDVKSD